MDLLRRCTLLSDIVCGRVRLGPTGLPRCAFPKGAGCGEPFPPETTGAFPGTEGQTATGRRFHPVDDGNPEPNVFVARCAHECPAGYATALAPQRIPTLLALEVQANGKTSLAQRPSGSDWEVGRRESYLGRGTHCQRIEAKTGDPVSPRTVRKYLNSGGPRREPDPKQRWLTFVRNHAKWIVASDFFVVVTVSFRTLYVFVIMELGTRRILHHNVTAHPTAEWTLQQFREALPGDHPYRFLIHDRDSIFSKDLDQAVVAMGVGVLRTPVRAPKANSVCERLGGTLRRECLDYLIPINERHLKMTIKEWGTHYNRGRPHSSLGPGLPEPTQESVPESGHRHQLPAGYRVVKDSVLGGLHHEYRLVKEAA